MREEDNTLESLINCLKERHLYLFGASKSAKGFIDRNHSKLRIEGLFDNNPEKWDKTFEGYRIFSNDQLLILNPEETVILITSIYEVAIERQLVDLGFKYIFSSHKCENKGYNWLASVKNEDMKYIKEVRNCLSDDMSKLKLDRIVEYRENNSLYWNEIFDGTAYFNDIISLSDEEVFIDGGAYIGDTITEFLQMVNKYKKIYAFEPDSVNFEKLKSVYGFEKDIKCIKSGLWSRNTNLQFNDFNTDGSKISEDGKTTIEVKSIDECIDEKVTYIKLDIEGSELDALKGAEKTIKKYRPKLAICIYHKYEDLWEIPLYIKSLVPNYKLYIRHHGLGCSDTVLYAVYE
jgi:FkbM family methyltransferase